MNDRVVSPSTGQGVLHLFWKAGPTVSLSGASTAIAHARRHDVQVVTVAILGHKAELATMALAKNFWSLRRLQVDLATAGLELVDSYVSMTEVSEYAKGLPDKMLSERLYPTLPPDGKPAWCFYPMSKRRNPDQNWFTLDFESRKELMYEHGASGRKFAGRITQLITGSTGVDDYEWGVTLFGQTPDDLKEVVYTMRFDHASAVYAEFGPFYSGMVADIDEIITG